MPFKKKSTKVVGVKGWEVEIPTPPKHATHARISCLNDIRDNGESKTATVPIRDFGVFRGVRGKFSYLRMDNKGKVHEEFQAVWEWDGKEVVGIEKMRDK
jgi:hypothetical protein